MKEILYNIIVEKAGPLKNFGIVIGKKEPDHKWLYRLAYNLDPENKIFQLDYVPHIRKPRPEENMMAPKAFKELLDLLPKERTKKKVKVGRRLLKRSAEEAYKQRAEDAKKVYQQSIEKAKKIK